MPHKTNKDKEPTMEQVYKKGESKKKMEYNEVTIRKIDNGFIVSACSSGEMDYGKRREYLAKTAKEANRMAAEILS